MCDLERNVTDTLHFKHACVTLKSQNVVDIHLTSHTQRRPPPQSHFFLQALIPTIICFSGQFPHRAGTTEQLEHTALQSG